MESILPKTESDITLPLRSPPAKFSAAENQSNIWRQTSMAKLFRTSNDVFKAWEFMLKIDESLEKSFRQTFPANPQPIKKFLSAEFSHANRMLLLHKNKNERKQSLAKKNNSYKPPVDENINKISTSSQFFNPKSLNCQVSSRNEVAMLFNKKKESTTESLNEKFLDAESSFERHSSPATSSQITNNSYRHRSCGRESASPSRSNILVGVQQATISSENLNWADRQSPSSTNQLQQQQKARQRIQPQFQITQGECELKRRLSGALDFDKNIKNVHLEDDYNIYKQLGTGRFGFVRLAEHRGSKIKIALKFFPRPQIKQSDFIREYNFSRFLSPHQNIIDTFEGTFHSLGDCAFFFVQEFCPYASLREVVEASNGSGIGELTTKKIMLKVLCAIEFMHSEGLVHRNIKAENVLIFDKIHYSKIKVTDFGLTRKMDTTVKHLEYINSYHAPELCETVVKEVLTVARSIDIWALGITFFYTLKGRFPWQKATIMCKPYWEWDQWLKHKLSQLPKQYEVYTDKALKLFKRCLNPKPKDRWSVKDLKKFVDKERLLKIKTVGEEPSLCPNYTDENTKSSLAPELSLNKQKKSTIHKLINTTFNAMAEISEQVVSARDA